MFKNLKEALKKVSVQAVKLAEETLGSNKGQEKKKMAIEYIISKLPIPFPFNKFIGILLSSFIDDAVEFAVQYMKTGGTDGTNE